ncbi:MAG: DNA-deoxyinosine glycosylase [Proteobacteria bacterium]|nr:DNA-deoxyinosine glycosylase [Cystobacterineae bacterium]MCL2258959.1 DNA-deoxyinosine glycosylase [Cystobacterineae bacterium]MCL2314883.1 DNA-deoxyinosine glycosylase [Pseudomonadota bacterium]
MRISCFEPIEDKYARVLILGSMPGQTSLAENQYYAHPHNAFWPILSEVLGFEKNAPYALKIQALKNAHIALWDVLQFCIREGSSLDVRIRTSSEKANDFQSFFDAHPEIQHVFFNGSKAQSCFKKHVLRKLNSSSSPSYVRLPSTSPAHASQSYAQKLEIWRTQLGCTLKLRLPCETETTTAIPTP